MIERTIETTTHGRYLVVPPASPGPAPVLVGFHGYAELAEAQLDRMSAIPGTDRWLLLSIQGLNRFYQRRTNDVIAGWMTRQHRELAIADNLAYVQSVVDLVHREWPTTPTLVYTGFSQGVAMAFRAAVAATYRPRSRRRRWLALAQRLSAAAATIHGTRLRSSKATGAGCAMRQSMCDRLTSTPATNGLRRCCRRRRRSSQRVIMVDVRRATAGDAAALAELRWEFRAGRVTPIETRDAFIARCADWMRRELVSERSWRAWVV